jgi:ubiquinone/menaquinone biosynthesis C-methylase UbiE/uncharacterized protein YbaR (Trm112 family)
MISFICPRCQTELEEAASDELHCPQDGLIFRCNNGIWRFLLPERESHYSRFISDYETVRRFEGRGSADSSFYRALPFHDLSGKFSADWKIRSASYLALKGELLPQSLQTILDMGAGNGWLSNRLSALGHQAFAIDLVVNSDDGLGAWRNYESSFTSVQSEFTRLPFQDNSISMVIFNASFHYSENYEMTLAEALRVLSQAGKIIIMDSPIYHNAKSGEQMILERKEDFLRRYGFASDSIKSENYLTYERMDNLSKKMNIHWYHIIPFYGIRWRLRPWLARLRGGREPAELGLWVGER